jgi:hypothetical protein
MIPRPNRWIALAVGLGLVVVTLLGMVVLGRSHKGPSVFAAITSAQSPAPSRAGSSSGSKNPSLSSPSTTGTRSPNAGTPTPTAVPLGAGATAPPTDAPPPPPPPAYTFAPPFTGGTATTSASAVAADLSGGRMVVATFTVNSTGPVSLHGFGSITALVACLDTGQGCAPGQIPNPGYWTLSDNDLAHSHTYTIRVSLPGGSAGLDIGWNGPKSLAMSNLDMSGACSTGGYQLGCGVRLRLSTSGNVSLGAGPGRFHTKARDKATGSVVPTAGDVGFTGSTTLSLPKPAAWTIYLWSDGPAAASMNISWP